MSDQQPRQASLRRMRQFGIRPNRELGQNFLIDDNILGVVGRLAELSPDDVVLEVGGGLGVLSRRLAERVRQVHVIEIDHRLEQDLRAALVPLRNVQLAASQCECRLAGVAARVERDGEPLRLVVDTVAGADAELELYTAQTRLGLLASSLGVDVEIASA